MSSLDRNNFENSQDFKSKVHFASHDALDIGMGQEESRLGKKELPSLDPKSQFGLFSRSCDLSESIFLSNIPVQICKNVEIFISFCAQL